MPPPKRHGFETVSSFHKCPTPPMSLRGAKRRGNLPGEGWIFRCGGMNSTGLYRALWVPGNRHIVPGDSHVASQIRNDIFFPWFGISLPVCSRNEGGSRPSPTVFCRTWFGLPPALLRSFTPLINAGGEGCSLVVTLVRSSGGLHHRHSLRSPHQSADWFAMKCLFLVCNDLGFHAQSFIIHNS